MNLNVMESRFGEISNNELNEMTELQKILARRRKITDQVALSPAAIKEKKISVNQNSNKNSIPLVVNVKSNNLIEEHPIISILDQSPCSGMIESQLNSNFDHLSTSRASLFTDMNNQFSKSENSDAIPPPVSPVSIQTQSSDSASLVSSLNVSPTNNNKRVHSNRRETFNDVRLKFEKLHSKPVAVPPSYYKAVNFTSPRGRNESLSGSEKSESDSNSVHQPNERYSYDQNVIDITSDCTDLLLIDGIASDDTDTAEITSSTSFFKSSIDINDGNKSHRSSELSNHFCTNNNCTPTNSVAYKSTDQLSLSIEQRESTCNEQHAYENQNITSVEATIATRNKQEDEEDEGEGGGGLILPAVVVSFTPVSCTNEMIECDSPNAQEMPLTLEALGSIHDIDMLRFEYLKLLELNSEMGDQLKFSKLKIKALQIEVEELTYKNQKQQNNSELQSSRLQVIELEKELEQLKFSLSKMADLEKLVQVLTADLKAVEQESKERSKLVVNEVAVPGGSRNHSNHGTGTGGVVPPARVTTTTTAAAAAVTLTTHHTPGAVTAVSSVITAPAENPLSHSRQRAPTLRGVTAVNKNHNDSPSRYVYSVSDPASSPIMDGGVSDVMLPFQKVKFSSVSAATGTAAVPTNAESSITQSAASASAAAANPNLTAVAAENKNKFLKKGSSFSFHAFKSLITEEHTENPPVDIDQHVMHSVQPITRTVHDSQGSNPMLRVSGSSGGSGTASPKRERGNRVSKSSSEEAGILDTGRNSNEIHLSNSKTSAGISEAQHEPKSLAFTLSGLATASAHNLNSLLHSKSSKGVPIVSSGRTGFKSSTFSRLSPTPTTTTITSRDRAQSVSTTSQQQQPPLQKPEISHVKSLRSVTSSTATEGHTRTTIPSDEAITKRTLFSPRHFFSNKHQNVQQPVVQSSPKVGLETLVVRLEEKLKNESSVDPWFGNPKGYLKKPASGFRRADQHRLQSTTSSSTVSSSTNAAVINHDTNLPPVDEIKNSTGVMSKTQSFLAHITHIFQMYRSRWFVLNTSTNTLKYYKDDKANRHEKGSIDMDTIIDIYTNQTADAPKYSLELISRTRRYTLVADSEDSMVKWAYVLNKARTLNKHKSSPLKTTHSNKTNKRKSGLEGLEQDIPEMNNMAHMYESSGEYEKAEKMYMRVLDETKLKYGDKHSETILAMSNIASLLQNQSKYDQSKVWNDECVRICKQAFGNNHIETLQAINKLAYLYEVQGKFELAEPLYVEISEIRKHVFDDLAHDHDDRESVDSDNEEFTVTL